MQKAKLSKALEPFRPTRVLVIDIGGTHVKLWLAGPDALSEKFDSGTTITPQEVVAETKELTAKWRYEAVTIGVPSPVKNGKLAQEPNNLGKGWVTFDFQSQFDKPVRVINDAALQALAAPEPGRVLFLGLGTGLGSALLVDAQEIALELSELLVGPNENLEDLLGRRGLKILGRPKWEKAVHTQVRALRKAFLADIVVIGGGNAKKLKQMPEGSRLGENSDVVNGGLRVWHVNP